MKTRNDCDVLHQRIKELEAEAARFRQMEESLRKSNAIISSIFSASPIGIGLVEDRIIQRVNAAMKKMFRYKSDSDYVGQSARILYATDEEFEAVGAYVYEKLRAGEDAKLDATFVRGDGTAFLGHLKVNTLTPERPMRRATFTISDISWRKQAEDQRLQKEKLQAVIETAGAVCHELNQPMQVSLMELIDLIQSGELAAGPVRERLEKIKDQLDAMRQLSRKLMRITRYETRDYIKGERIIDIDKASGV
jgi:PAS domain S-box-containing protein